MRWHQPRGIAWARLGAEGAGLFVFYKAVISAVIAAVVAAFARAEHLPVAEISVFSLVGFAGSLWALNGLTWRRDRAAFRRSTAGTALSGVRGYIPRKAKPRATAKELEAREIVDRMVMLTDFDLGKGATISGKVFRSCQIQGPVVVFMNGCVLLEPTVAFHTYPESILWPREPDPEHPIVVGAIGLEGCTFDHCRFDAVGFAGTAEFLRDLRDAMASGAYIDKTQPDPHAG